jgi:hypothetical protein
VGDVFHLKQLLALELDWLLEDVLAVGIVGHHVGVDLELVHFYFLKF